MVLEVENPLFVDRVQPYKLMGIEILSKGLTPQFTLYDLISFGKVVHVFLVRLLEKFLLPLVMCWYQI